MTVSDPITNPETEMIDELANAADTVHQKLIDALSPGYQPEFAPDEPTGERMPERANEEAAGGPTSPIGAVRRLARGPATHGQRTAWALLVDHQPTAHRQPSEPHGTGARSAFDGRIAPSAGAAPCHEAKRRRRDLQQLPLRDRQSRFRGDAGSRDVFIQGCLRRDGGGIQSAPARDRT